MQSACYEEGLVNTLDSSPLIENWHAKHRAVKALEDLMFSKNFDLSMS